METIVSILVIVLVFSLAINVYSYLAINKLFKRNDFFEKHFIEVANLLTYVQTRLAYLDRTGAFASDDEIGFAYTEIKSLWKILISAGLRTTDEKGNQENPAESNIEFKDGNKVY